MLQFREQLIRIQRNNYRRNVELLRESLEYSPKVDIYEKEYYRRLKNYQGISSKSELLKRIIGSDVVFHGDYHTLRQSQRCVLRILREIHDKRSIILCLEMFHGADQKHLDQFLQRQINEAAFINKIEYSKKWPFSWRNWSSLIYFCREKGVPIVGINSKSGTGIGALRKRDKYSARIIAKTRIRFPDRLIYVVDGDFHVSPNHLPKEVDTLLQLLDCPSRHLIVYQNVENLYWKLCQQQLEEADVIKIDDNSYCVMNTMPANKVQSYLNWLEYSVDAYFPIHREWADAPEEGQGLTIQEMVPIIASVLQLELPVGHLEKLSVYYGNDLHFMDFIHEHPILRTKLPAIKDKIARDEGFLLEFEDQGEGEYLIYLPNSNINMAAEEAAHFVNALLRGISTSPLSPFDRFYRNAVTECLGFLGSKFINEKRKAHSENSLRRLLGQIKKGEYVEVDPLIPQVARHILQHFYLQRKTEDAVDYENKFRAQFRSRSPLAQMFSTQLGYIAGNKLYYAVKKGKYPLANVQKLFQACLDEPQEAFRCYLSISSRLKGERTVSQF